MTPYFAVANLVCENTFSWYRHPEPFTFSHFLIIDDIRFTYFLKKGYKVLLFDAKTIKEATKIINESDLVLISSNYDLKLITELIEHNPTNKRIMVHKVPEGIDAFLFTGDQELAIDDFWPI